MLKDAKAQKSAEQAQDRERMARIVKEHAAAKEKAMLEIHQATASGGSVKSASQGRQLPR
ncbi:MAG TPA: hypothetical protein VI488_00650 [Candidatus Angelobacter sp.]